MTIFSALIALGSVLGLLWAVYQSSPRIQHTLLNAGILVLFSALVGGRMAYVAVSWEYFQDHFIEIPQIWLGGLAWPGALAGGILGAFVVAWISNIHVGELLDRLLPLIACLSVATWMGCWVNGCAYGAEVELGLPVIDEWGFWKKRIPLQIIGATMSVILFWGIESYRLQKKNFPPGLLTSFGVGGLCLIMLVASFLRADPYPIYGGFRLETWAALLFFVISCLSGLLATFLSRHKK